MSMLRLPQRWPLRRPRRRSTVLASASSAGGASAVAIQAALLAKRRCAGPMGVLWTVGPIATMRHPPATSAAIAALIIAAGVTPPRARRLLPSAIRYWCSSKAG